MIVAPGATSVSCDVFFADDSGFALTGKVAADFPACKWSGGANAASTTITLSDLAAITTAHPNDNTAGGLKEREGGWYRLDLPNNMFTSAGRKTITFVEATNKRILAPTFDCQYTQADVRQLLGTAWLSPGTAGTPDVNVKLWNALATVALPLVPTTAGRTLDVSAGGEAGVDWANVGSPTTTLALTGTTVADTQKVDVNTVKTQTVTCAAGVTIRADVGAAAAPGSANGMLIGGSNAATTFATLTVTGAVLFSSTFATTGTTTFNAFTVTNALTVSGTTTLTGAVSLGSTLGVTGTTTLAAVTTTGTVTFNAFTVTNAFTVSGTTTHTGAVTFTAGLTSNITGNITGNLVGTVSVLTTYTGNTPQTGDSFARIGATGSSLTSLAPAATALSTVQWSNALATLLGGFVFTVPGFVDANIQYVNDVAVAGTGAPGFEWGPA